MNCFQPSLVLLSITAVSASASVLPQRDVGHVVLRAGDTLSNGKTVEFLRESRMDDQGNWAALVYPEGVAYPEEGTIVRNGQVHLEPGSVLPSGEVVSENLAMDLGPGGTLCSSWGNWEPGTTSAVAMEHSVVLKSGDTISGQGIPMGSMVSQVKCVRVAMPFALLVGLVDSPGLVTRRAALLLDFSNPGPPTVEGLIFEGDVISGIGEAMFVKDFRGSTSLAPDGAFAINIVYRDSQNNVREYVHTEAGPFAVPEQPTSTPGTLWDTYFPQVHTIGRGLVSISTPVRVVGLQGFMGAVFGPAGEITRVGAPIPGTLGWTAGGFVLVRQEMNRHTQELAMLIPVSTGGTNQKDIVWYAGEVLFDEELDTIGGYQASLFDLHLGGRGESILLSGQLSGGGFALVVVERSVGEVNPCSVVSNTTGTTGKLMGEGSSYVLANKLTLEATQLPVGQFALLLTSPASGFVANPAGSQGHLCLGDAIGRFNSLVQATDNSGEASFSLDLTELPSPSGPTAVLSGETWFFQVWHRDTLPSGASASNFTETLVVEFR